MSSDTLKTSVTSFPRLDFTKGYWLTFSLPSQLRSCIIISSISQVTILWHLNIFQATSDQVVECVGEIVWGYSSFFHQEDLWLVCLCYLSGFPLRSGRAFEEGTPCDLLAQQLITNNLFHVIALWTYTRENHIPYDLLLTLSFALVKANLISNF